MAFEIDDRRRSLLDNMDGNDIPGPDGTGGYVGTKLPVLTGGPEERAPAPVAPTAPSPVAPADPFANPGGSDIDALIRRGFEVSSDRTPNDTDFAYWRGKWPELVARGQQLGDPDYAWKRLIGMGAGPQDAAARGPWAGGDPLADVNDAGDKKRYALRAGTQPNASATTDAAIQAELQALVNGRTSPLNRASLLQQLV